MSQEDPPRLRGNADTPDELSRALDALRDRPSDIARVARVAAKLGPVLDGGPLPAAQVQRAPGGLGRIAGWKLGLAAAAFGIGATWLAWPADIGPDARASRDPAASPPSHEAQPTNAPVPAAPGAAPARSTQRSARSVERAAGKAPRSAPPVELKPVEGPHRAAQSRHSAPSTEQRVSAPKTEPHVSASGQPASGQPADAVNDAFRGSRPKRVKRSDQNPPRPRKSELELLFEARSLKRTAPEEALRLLDEHAERFRGGMLAPERDVLVIEILRSLGKTPEAELRLARFRELYPESIHLPRLEGRTP